jgi:4-alpha-glucanotransferase
MANHLDDLAASHGILIHYTAQDGSAVEIPDEAKRSLLKVLGVDPDTGEPGAAASMQLKATLSCPFPSWLQGKGVWGVTCQLYALRSMRNLGIGDFEDLARLAEFVAGLGADFLGVNPLHALFIADPQRTSPYSPSTRRFLNPIYIAVDQIQGGKEAIERLRRDRPDLILALGGELVDYPAVGGAKTKLLRLISRSA